MTLKQPGCIKPIKNLSLGIVLMIVSGSLSSAQEVKISGKVKNVDNEGIIGATVKVMNQTDSIFIKGVATDLVGVFEINNLKEGSYFLEISSISYQTVTQIKFTIIATTTHIVLPNIFLVSDQINLEEVVVTAKRPPIVYETDRTIINVESISGNLSSNTVEILEKSPGVILDEQGSISLNGKMNVTVLIDNRPTYMSGPELISYLKSLPAGVVDKIELMDNPPARYGASGGAIINIVLRKQTLKGLTGSVNASLSQGETTRHSEWFYLNERGAKWNFYTNGGYNRGANYYNVIFDRNTFDQDQNLISNTYSINSERFHNDAKFARLGGDYYITADAVMGFIVNIQSIPRYSNNIINGELHDFLSNNDVLSTGTNTSEFTWQNRTINLNYQQKFGKSKADLTADLNVIKYISGANQNFESNSLNITDIFNYASETEYTIYNFKSDYTKSIMPGIDIEAGIASSILTNDAALRHTDNNQGIPVYDPSRSNHFVYDENAHNAYLSARKSFKKLSTQLGLRVESISLKAHLLANEAVMEEIYNQRYTKIFPTAYLSYQFDSLSNNSLAVSYSKRIGRPTYQQFNPFIRYNDAYTYETGNVSLLPSLTHQTELSYIFRRVLNLRVAYIFGNDLIFNAFEVVDDKVFSKPYNFGTEKTFSFSASFRFDPLKCWTMNYGAQMLSSKVSGQINTTSLRYGAANFSFRLFNQFQINKKISADFTFNYFGRETVQQMVTRPRYIAYGGVQFKILKDMGTLKINLEDIFYTTKRKGYILGLSNTEIYRGSEFDSRRLGVALTYRFGNDKYQRKRNHQLQELN